MRKRLMFAMFVASAVLAGRAVLLAQKPSSPIPMPLDAAEPATDDPMNAVESFVRRNRKEADDSIKVLAQEAETLKARLQKVEAALARWQSVADALKPEGTPSGGPGPNPKRGRNSSPSGRPTPTSPPSSRHPAHPTCSRGLRWIRANSHRRTSRLLVDRDLSIRCPLPIFPRGGIGQTRDPPWPTPEPSDMAEGEKPDASPTPSAGWGSLARIAARAVSSLFAPPPVPVVTPTSAAMPRIVSTDTSRAERVPRGQVRTTRWPVLHAGPTPKVDLATWDLKVFGAVESEKSWTWDEFRGLAPSTVFADMHCVTRWSRLDNTWEGVPVREVMSHVGLKPEAKFVLVHAEHGYTTNLPLDEFLGEDCLFAWSHDGRPLTLDHGWPLRLVVPRLYAWKSAKWVRGLEFLEADQPGFWEQNGYHNHGDPWLEQRFW